MLNMKQDPRIMKYIPKSKRAAINECWIEDALCAECKCSYWITLKEGWEFGNLDAGARIVSQDTIKDLRYQIAGIQKAE